jgi:hypothetical protein
MTNIIIAAEKKQQVYEKTTKISLINILLNNSLSIKFPQYILYSENDWAIGYN